MQPTNVLRSIALVCLLALLAACSSAEDSLLAKSGTTLEDPVFHPSDDYLRKGKMYFHNGDYGLAEQSYRKAVEVSPKDAEAWLGLAACYDQLRRFDLADKAYEQALKLGVERATVLNNAGYSQLLRGDLKSARRLMLQAYELEPKNPYILNNLKLLGESAGSVKRPEM